MARPIKEGLSYFPLDIDFFQDEKIEFVAARFAEKGELIAVKLLCKIFRQGYYLQWDEDLALLFSKGAGKNITHFLVNDVVNELLKRGFFDPAMYKRFAILTSNGIQKRYLKICVQSGRKSVISEKYRVYSKETGVKSNKTGINSGKSTQTKENKRKQKKTKPQSAGEGEIFFKNSEEQPVMNGSPPKFFSLIGSEWQVWKAYMQKAHKFSYDAEFSEPKSVENLQKLSGGDVEKATAIINQSIRKNWKDFYELKLPQTEAKPKEEPLPAGRKVRDKLRDEINYLFQRFCEDETHVTVISVDVLHYDYMKKNGYDHFFLTDKQEEISEKATELALQAGKKDQDAILHFMKRVAVIEIFKVLKRQGKETVLS